MTTEILLIDDEVRILQTFSRTLKLAGYTVFTAESGEEGLSLYHREQPDVVLLDLRMPGLDGLTVLQRIRQHDPEANVILCTGHGDKDAVIRALRAGASDFLPKPVDQVTLESALRRAEERVHLKRELRASQRALEEQNVRLEEEVRVRTAALEREIEERKRAHAALQESEEKYRLLAETTQDIIALHDMEGRIVYLNQAGLDFAGFDGAAEAMGKLITAFIPEEDRADVEARRMQRVRGDGQTYRYETTFVNRDGERVPAEVNSTPILRQGRVSQVLLVARDITERKRADEALQESEERYRRLVEGSPDILYVYSDRRGALYWSKRVEEVLGFAPTDLIETPYLWHNAIHPDDVAAVDEAIAGRHEAAGFEIEYRIQDVDGGWHWFHDRLISKRQVGDEVIIEGLATDITERKQAEEALLRRNQYLQALQGTTLELISQFDLETLLKNIVSRAASLLGTTSGFLNLVDPDADQLVLRVAVGAVTEAMAPTVQLGEGMAGRVWQTGEPVVVNDYDSWANRLLDFNYNAVGAMIGVPLRSGEEIVGVLGLAYDVPSRQTFGSEEIELLTQFARLATVAIENARLLEQTQRDADRRAPLG